MYVCKSCGQTFYNIKTWIEDRGECFGFPSYEKFQGSPCCHAGYAKARQCDSCGDYLVGDYIKLIDGTRYCEECYQPMELGDED